MLVLLESQLKSLHDEILGMNVKVSASIVVTHHGQSGSIPDINMAGRKDGHLAKHVVNSPGS